MTAPSGKHDGPSTSIASSARMTAEYRQPHEAATEAPPARQKLTVALPVEDIAKLEELGERWGNKTTALIRATRTIHYLVMAVSAGSKVMLHDSDGSKREVLLM